LVKSGISRRKGGFTLLEGIVGVGALGFLITALYSGMTSGFSVVRFARENLRATQVLQEKFESMRLYTWDQVNSTNFVPPTFTAPMYGTGSAGAVYEGTVTISRPALTEAYADD